MWKHSIRLHPHRAYVNSFIGSLYLPMAIARHGTRTSPSMAMVVLVAAMEEVAVVGSALAMAMTEGRECLP